MAELCPVTTRPFVPGALLSKGACVSSAVGGVYLNSVLNTIAMAHIISCQDHMDLQNPSPSPSQPKRTAPLCVRLPGGGGRSPAASHPPAICQKLGGG